MSKPKVAFFDFACCEGCQLQIANMGEELLDVLGIIEVVEFREVMSEKFDKDYDVVFIEGSITTPHAEERIKKIRERTKVLIAYGACACIGGVNGMKNNYNLDEVRKEVYGDKANFFPTIPTKAVDQVVKVDYYINGCPVYLPEVVKVLKHVLKGIPYAVPDDPVCNECILNENTCMFEKGVTCLGPITRSGCNSWCINNGNVCYGCRGMVSNPNKSSAVKIFEKYGVDLEFAKKKMAMYNTCKTEENNE